MSVKCKPGEIDLQLPAPRYRIERKVEDSFLIKTLTSMRRDNQRHGSQMEQEKLKREGEGQWTEKKETDESVSLN